MIANETRWRGVMRLESIVVVEGNGRGGMMKKLDPKKERLDRCR